MKLSLLAGLFLLVGVGGGLVGCNSEADKPSSQEIKDFKGGTPPPEAAKKMQEGMSKGSQGAKVIQ